MCLHNNFCKYNSFLLVDIFTLFKGNEHNFIIND